MRRSAGCPSTQSRHAHATAPPPPPPRHRHPRTPHLAPAPAPASRAEALLVSRWQSILISTISMLASPNLDSPANLDAAVRARPAWRRAPAPKPSRPDPASAPPLRAPPRDRAPPPRPLTSPRALAPRPRPAQKEMRETPDIFKKKARPSRCCPAPTPPTPRTTHPVLTAPCHPTPRAASAPGRPEQRGGREGWVPPVRDCFTPLSPARPARLEGACAEARRTCDDVSRAGRCVDRCHTQQRAPSEGVDCTQSFELRGWPITDYFV